MHSVLFRITLVAVLAALCLAEEPASDSALTPRQLFYSPRAQSKTQTPVKPRPARPKAAAPEQQAAPVPAPPRAEPEPQAKSAPEAPAHLGLRYVVRQVTDNGTRDVDPDKTFFSGDRIKIGVEANDSAYLYVVQEGSDGRWEPLYPTSAGQHRIRALATVDIPPGNEDFTFDTTPGTERLLVVLSRTPERDLDRLIDSLRGGTPARRDASGQLMASAAADPIGKLRATLQSRNLRVQKRPEVSAGRREDAVYVVNASTGDAGGRVVAEILLKHR
jgi:type IV secretory pathway VirB10-like protein